MGQAVGMVGVGVMGFAMAANLRQAGFEVVGYDPVPAAIARLAGIGASGVGSARAVAEACSIVILSLPSSQALAAAVEGDTGLAAAATEGLVAIECSTLPLADKRAAFEVMAAAGQTLLDCPLSGTGAQAVVKDLVVFGSGDQAAFERCRPVFEGMSRVQRYLGAFGNGSVMKYLANLLVTIHNVSTAEAMVLGLKAGLDPSLIYDTLADSAGTSRMFQVRGPLMRDASYDTPTFTIRTHLKDLAIIGDFVQELNSPTPLFSAAAQIYHAGAAQGRDMQDTAAVCAVLEGLAGLPSR
ncbi:NAD(P)-dependent oxidoreductase [Hyphomicrobiales bacterium BP6-180914]|uniref:NAD(P)-dependent oxidoreductase n=2 Tax=Lichenifustis flavocetrariae TaxID=2949735 RepID=A0AA41Z1D1_9HYPH|nr:NAD(P)-dependent oxidoreductase [Lichenifustis flavocetrariae]